MTPPRRPLLTLALATCLAACGDGLEPSPSDAGAPDEPEYATLCQPLAQPGQPTPVAGPCPRPEPEAK
jgi:hypothetical protein